jgi:CheY-like chemotaxis protein
VRSQSPAAPAFRVLGDQPYAAKGDPFGFGDLAQQLKALILSSRASTPFTIGIEASWGRGKSSLMAQLHEELRRTTVETDGVEIRPVTFNAWTAEGEDVLEGLVKSVLEAMDKNALRRALRNKRLVSAVKIPLLLVAGYLRVGGLVDEAWNALSVDARTRNQVNDLVTKAMEEWFQEARQRTSSLEPDRLLVVFIDDLDRCSPENVLKIFEGLKLYLDAPGFVFVIGYDEGVVAEAVADQKQYSTRATGRDYIEKIVQIVFRIPQPTDEEVDELLGHFLSESQTTTLFDDAGRKLVIDRNGRNPRRIKRFVNRFILDYQLDEASQDLTAELLIKLLIFETYFPDFARLFAVTGQKNPIQEFLDFAAAREQLRRGAAAEPVVEEVFRAYGITRGETNQESLQRLEQEAPEVFSRLVRDEDFSSLAQSLTDREHQGLILAKVQRRRERESTVPTTETAPAPATPGAPPTPAPTTPPNVVGRRILWIDDKPANNAKLADLLRSYGAQVELATNGAGAREILLSFSPELVLSDVGREGNSNAGFEDVLAFRNDGLYTGPVIFYSGRISPSKRSRAQALDAPIVGEEPELFRAINEQLPPSSVAA